VKGKLTAKEFDLIYKELRANPQVCFACKGKLWGWIMIPTIPVCKKHSEHLPPEPPLPQYIRRITK